MKEKNEDYMVKIEKIFEQYLKDNNFRRTQERFTILREIYSRTDHFDTEELYIFMKNQDYRVSRATVYNTLELLVNCNLIKKHQFGKNLALYERSYGFKQHDHVICTKCGKVVEFCDPRVQQIKTMVGEMMNFQIDDHALNLYGVCADCQNKS